MEHTTEISIAVQRNPRKALEIALSKLTVQPAFPKEASEILIKPSIYDPSSVGNTESTLVKAVTQTFGNLGHISIIESDNPVRTTMEAFQKTGYIDLVGPKVKLVNLSELPLESVRMAGHHFESLKMPSVLIKPNFLVNVPTLKLEPEICTIGGGIKNLFGLIPERDKRHYHDNINQVLLDLLTAFRPDLTIMDLTSLVIGKREDGITKNSGAIIVGIDPVAVDAFCSDLLGIDPTKVKHLQRAHELGLGEIIIDNMKIRGTEDQKRKLFELFML